MAKTPKKRKCEARGCGETYVPVRDNQRYHSQACANREKQRRLRKRMRERRAAA